MIAMNERHDRVYYFNQFMINWSGDLTRLIFGLEFRYFYFFAQHAIINFLLADDAIYVVFVRYFAQVNNPAFFGLIKWISKIKPLVLDQ